MITKETTIETVKQNGVVTMRQVLDENGFYVIATPLDISQPMRITNENHRPKEIQA